MSLRGYGSGIVIVTCAHVVKGVELVDVYFPSVDESNDVKIRSIVFQSPASDLDISILPIEHGLLFGAVAIDDVTPDREASVSFAPAWTLMEIRQKRLWPWSDIVSVEPSIGFQLSIMQPLKSTAIERKFAVDFHHYR
ncbi:hypothetical protein [Mesorhizobium sp. M0847]|uniref:hypothetical protein n=1 Tax=unclassified Mesorhizobium TaxID=325217 RepID=UPI00333A19A0